jgi:hypothetical protein
MKKKTSHPIARAHRAVKRAAHKVDVAVREMVKVEHPSMPPQDSFDHRPIERASEIGFSGNPNEAILDNLAGIANRVDDWLAHGPGFNLENRLRARLSTPGLREWVKARMGS